MMMFCRDKFNGEVEEAFLDPQDPRRTHKYNSVWQALRLGKMRMLE